MTDEFNAERARDNTLDSLWFAREAVVANAGRLVPKIMEQFGAPTETHAHMGLNMTVEILTLLLDEIAASPIEEIGDAAIMLDAMKAAAQKKAH